MLTGSFEREMRGKLTQKCPGNMGEEQFLAKCFKFFDFQNKGEVNFDQFFRTVEKIGIIIEKPVSQCNTQFVGC